jgi:AcrR family transcriptional regulator
MVEALLHAAELEIGERGLDDVTTNHIAARAGVGVGSLYQYFDGKESMIEAVMQRHAARLLASVDTRGRPLLDADARTITRHVLEGVFEVVESDPSHREIARHWHRLRSGATFAGLEQRMIETCRQYLLRHHRRYPVDDLPAVLFVIINSVQYAVAHYLSLERPLLSQKALIDALADMVAAYLESGLKGRAGAKSAREKSGNAALRVSRKPRRATKLTKAS